MASPKVNGFHETDTWSRSFKVMCDEKECNRSLRSLVRRRNHCTEGLSQTIGLHTRDFFAITLAKKSLFYYNDVYKVQAVYKRKACTSF